MRSSKTIHICTFAGQPTTTKAAPGEVCGISGCNESATGYALYPWGSSPLCAGHYREETGTDWRKEWEAKR